MSGFNSIEREKSCYDRRPKHPNKQKKIELQKIKKEAQFNPPSSALSFKVK